MKSAHLLPWLTVIFLGLGNWADAQSFAVAVDQGVMTIAAEDAPTVAVVRELARRTGLTLSGTEYLTGKTTAHFSTADVKKALRTLSGRTSFAWIEYAEQADAARPIIEVKFTGGESRAPPPQARAPNNGHVLVENRITGRMEVQPPSSMSPTRTPPPPKPAGTVVLLQND